MPNSQSLHQSSNADASGKGLGEIVRGEKFAGNSSSSSIAHNGRNRSYTNLNNQSTTTDSGNDSNLTSQHKGSHTSSVSINESLASSTQLPSASASMITPPLHSFLSHYGVVAARQPTHSQVNQRTANTDVSEDAENLPWASQTITPTVQMESIFETSLDLTDERLKYIFESIDIDGDGRISYSELQKGLEIHTSSIFSGGQDIASVGGSDSLADSQTRPIFTEESFNALVQFLDQDGSLDITLQEFSTGLRTIMLQLLLQEPPPPSPSSGPASSALEVLDYDAHQLVRKDVLPGTVDTGNLHLMSTSDFYLQKRPPWVKTRWINVYGKSSPQTLKRLAVRYVLHPLALEDALDPQQHRPKAEVYSNHYFIMVPVFCVSPLKTTTSRVAARKSLLRTLKGLVRKSFCGLVGEKKSSTHNFVDQKVGKIEVQMTSIFVNVPTDDTIITYHPMAYRHPPSLNEDCGQNEQVSEPLHCWERIYRELEKSYSKLRQYDAQYLTYAILDRAVDLLDPIITLLRHDILREQMTLRETKYKHMERIHVLKGEVATIAAKLKPFIRLLVHVIEDDAISPGATVYLRDVLDNLECHDETVKQLLTLCQSIDEDADKFGRAQMDNTLYTLTVISAVFLPAQFLTGVWGMNFVYMPELDEPWGYKMFWGVSTSVILLLVFTLNFGRT